MFKNPLKYQQGGSTPSAQQQEQLVQLFQAAAKNAQVDPQALVQKAQEFGQDEQTAAQFMEGLQRCAQGDPAGIQFIKSLFTSSHKRGGKIQDFICKHGKGGAVAGCGCSKSIEKAQDGTNMPYTRGSYQPSDYFNNTGTWIDTPNGLAQNYRPYTFGGRTWGFGGNDLEQILVIPGEYGTPRRAVRRISNWFNPDVPTERLDTTYQDANGNRRNSAEFEARVNRELEGVSGSRPTTKENGGKVEKAKDGTKMSLFTNTLKRIPPRIYSSNPLNPSNSWRFIVENFDKEHPDSSIIAPRVMGGEHVYTRTYDQFGIPHTTVNDNSIQSEASEIFNIYRDAQKALQGDNSWGQPNTTYNIK